MKIKQYLHITHPDKFLKGCYRDCFSLFDHHSLVDTWICCGEIEIEVNVDTGEMIDTVTAAIDAEILKTKGELEGKINILESRKNELLALTHEKSA